MSYFGFSLKLNFFLVVGFLSIIIDAEICNEIDVAMNKSEEKSREKRAFLDFKGQK